MIYRFLFVGYSDNVRSVKLLPDSAHYAALSCEHGRVFLYAEANEPTVDPDKLAAGELIPYPNGAKWERAIEIFHYSRPVTAEQWRRKKEKTPHVKVNWLKPEKIAGYIFYHHQYQEEYPGDGDRYGIIFLHGEELIFYLEDPTENETEKIEGALTTKNTPKDRWGAVMSEHFADQWRDIENLEHSAYIGFGGEE